MVSKSSVLKKLRFVLLGVLLFLQAGGLLMYYEVQQMHARTVMQQYLAQEDCRTTKLTLTLDAFQAARHGDDELLLDGEMYDIKDYRISGDSICLSVVHDEREGHYYKKIAQVLQHRNHEGKSLPESFAELMTFEYLLPADYTITRVFPCAGALFPRAEWAPVSRSGSVLSPPPDCGFMI